MTTRKSEKGRKAPAAGARRTRSRAGAASAETAASLTDFLPMIPLKDVVVFPSCITPLFVMRPRSLAALESAVSADKRLFLVAQKSVEVENPSSEDLMQYGTIAEVLQVLKMPDGSAKILVEGQAVAEVLGYSNAERNTLAMLARREDAVDAAVDRTAPTRLLLSNFETYVQLMEKFPNELFISIKNMSDPLQQANAISHYANFKTKDKQQLLETGDLDKKLELLNQLLVSENELLELEGKIMTQVKSQIGKSQKEYFLNEQLKAIEKELGLNGEEDVELDELAEKISKAKMSEEATEKANRELGRLSKMAPLSPEATVSRTYIEWLTDLPWTKRSKDKTDLDRAQGILDEDHFGLNKVKDRIIEFLAVHALTKNVKGPLLCLVGPPGVGKTSLARSIARSLGRQFIRISLGGVRDEAEIRGHRRTYIGSLPGKLVQSMKKAATINPVFLLDEIDKMSADFRGDPASALLEVLDPEQNKNFNDHYLEVDYDLSDVFFIMTANTTAGIPGPLLDRMEIIRIPGYTEDEKLAIARQYLVPKQMKINGLDQFKVEIGDDALNALIMNYTREAGVRSLEREVATLCRRVVKDIVKAKPAPKTKRSASNPYAGRARQPITIDQPRVRELLGPERFKDMEINRDPEVGVTTGLAWTEVGGEILPAEVTVMKGRGQLVLTGKMGEVMQESAKAALSYIRSRSLDLKVPADFYKNCDIHVHIPEGAIPKDGPSAGVTMTTSMVSALTKSPVRQDIAMTGEITLRGKVLRIGGLKEKVMAAHRHNIRTIIMPHENEGDLEDLSGAIRDDMDFVMVDSLEQVLAAALVPAGKRGAGAAAPRKPAAPRTRATPARPRRR